MCAGWHCAWGGWADVCASVVDAHLCDQLNVSPGGFLAHNSSATETISLHNLRTANHQKQSSGFRTHPSKRKFVLASLFISWASSQQIGGLATKPCLFGFLFGSSQHLRRVRSVTYITLPIGASTPPPPSARGRNEAKPKVPKEGSFWGHLRPGCPLKCVRPSSGLGGKRALGRLVCPKERN